MPHTLTAFRRFVAKYSSYITPEFWRTTKRILDWHLDQDSDWEAACDEVILGLQDLKHHQRIPQWAHQQDEMEGLPIIGFDKFIDRMVEVLNDRYGSLRNANHRPAAEEIANSAIEWWLATEMSDPTPESKIK